MRFAADVVDAAFEALDVQTSDDAAIGLNLVTTVRLYALQRLSSGAVPESTGNGRVEFLCRLAKFAVHSFEQTPQALAPRAPAIFS